MNIIHTIASLKGSAGGPSRTVTSICSALSTQGISVEIVTQDYKSPHNFNVMPETNDVNVIFVPALYIPQARIVYSPAYSNTLRKRCRQRKVQLIHDHGLWLSTNHSSAAAARRLKIPLVMNPHGMLEPWALSFRAWKKKLAWKLYQKRDIESATLLVASAVQEIESIRKVGLRQPIAMIPYGIDLQELKERHFTNERQRYGLFLSRIHPKKGLLNLVAAWDRVRPEGWRMIVAGPDEDNHRADVELAAQRAGLEKVFQFVGSVEGEAKEKLYRNADLFILPTYSENFGVVVADALSYGVPVITTKGAPWKGLINHKCGWWIDIGVEPLVVAMHEATTMSDEARQDMGQRARDYIAQHFSKSNIAEQMLSVYEWVLKKGVKPDCVLLD